jgi:hypothetical protein
MVTMTESTDDVVRWQITMTGAPWGLTYGNKAAVNNSGWRIRTDEWCHMEPEWL